jgi:hypothetical protein
MVKQKSRSETDPDSKAAVMKWLSVAVAVSGWGYIRMSGYLGD